MYALVERIVALLKKVVPDAWVRPLLPRYHRTLAFASALAYGFPARSLTVIGVTGTKGKSSVADMLFTVLRHARYPTAVAGTIRFAINDQSEPNLFKMTMPGRGFIQHFLARAKRAGCRYAVVEITSESTLNFRHRHLDLDALVFTNLQREHIERHGSFEKYAAAKLEIGRELARSPKRPRAIIPNGDDPAAAPYLALPVEEKRPFSYAEATAIALGPGTAAFTYHGTRFSLQLPGSFSIMNSLAVIKAAEFLGVPLPAIADALAKLERIPGRTERIEAGQDFTAVVDYAHTPDSLEALYAAYPVRKVCVLGNTGGGRDTWKRPLMGKIADAACDLVILTNEDPYDEDPRAIVDAMAAGMVRQPEIVMDRREAIRRALAAARPGDAVLVTGKGTDPYIMGAAGAKELWSDAQVVRDELKRLLSSKP
ncbi:MAG: UDP-N-acetylmuramyl-tripeptide synthetase [Patescibacteria group bacterium]|nr:UDP-N-acetylmuramyl-tripeptide synthetase [Patescibacteria group bacterium]MDE1944087.1 UDP-N-acetylmuramyl-tripeptide synthetase [Patescibacteria group bacterium]MDE1944704.1 UDP-N-acetylmuramyl-tripeptide synthetase [Patescibacteria group bacterium]MDE2057595.1 UDP-N-acetylmuramyl-tripeptide synthetase [Patescibacteria group bacterium]